MKYFFSLIIFLALSSLAWSQDSLEVIEAPTTIKNDSAMAHSPKKASILSMVLPGAGQVYNKKYWKVPVIYIGLGALIYLNRDYNSFYTKYQSAYNEFRQPYLDLGKAVDETKSITIEGVPYSPAIVAAARDQSRKYRDLTTMGIVLVYVLNIIDASVDAYFFDYDMSDNLALHINPEVQAMPNYNTSFGMRCSIRFK